MTVNFPYGIINHFLKLQTHHTSFRGIAVLAVPVHQTTWFCLSYGKPMFSFTHLSSASSGMELCLLLPRRPLCVCACSQSFSTLCGYNKSRPPDSSVHGISQARILEWVVIFYSRGSFWPRDWILVSWVFCIGRRFFTTSPTWEAPDICLNFPPRPSFYFLGKSFMVLGSVLISFSYMWLSSFPSTNYWRGCLSVFVYSCLLCQR